VGSRRGRHAALAAGGLALAVAGACSTGRPIGFSKADRWTIPLVGPLEDGLLLAPVYIAAKGPYLFAIDPDATVSAVEQGIVEEAGLRIGEGPHLLDEDDREIPEFYAEVLDLQVGTLTIRRTSNASALVVKNGTFDANGRHIRGLLGRDVIADSLVFGFDRDQGVAMLMTQEAFHPPPGAIAISYDKVSSQIVNVEVVPPPRRLVTATVDGHPFTLHVAFGATASRLRASAWRAAGLVAEAVEGGLVDDIGSHHPVHARAKAASVALGSARTERVAFVPYGDRRWDAKVLDGVLGLDFFRPYDVIANWDRTRLYLTPRGDLAATTKARIGRWHSAALDACPDLGCVQVKLIDPLAGAPAAQLPAHHPGVVVTVERDARAAGIPLEVLLQVTPAAGKPALPWLVASLPAAAPRAMTHLPADYVGATLTVVDADPFPRACPTPAGCIDRLTLRGQ
jgi:hypothetical protein